MHTHDGDDTLFDIFNELDVDFAKPREVNFYFIFSTQADAENAARDLRQIDFPCEIFQHRLPWWKRCFFKPDWTVSTTRQMPLEIAEIKRLTTAFGSVARKHHGQYDGWEACVAEDQVPVSKLNHEVPGMWEGDVKKQ
ncbi:MAG: ribonuclease E inhibitor RraB [Planctomycetota bacterium]|jgi:hypothetical protein